MICLFSRLTCSFQWMFLESYKSCNQSSWTLFTLTASMWINGCRLLSKKWNLILKSQENQSMHTSKKMASKSNSSWRTSGRPSSSYCFIFWPGWSTSSLNYFLVLLQGKLTINHLSLESSTSDQSFKAISCGMAHSNFFFLNSCL